MVAAARTGVEYAAVRVVEVAGEDGTVGQQDNRGEAVHAVSPFDVGGAAGAAGSGGVFGGQVGVVQSPFPKGVAACAVGEPRAVTEGQAEAIAKHIAYLKETEAVCGLQGMADGVRDLVGSGGGGGGRNPRPP